MFAVAAGLGTSVLRADAPTYTLIDLSRLPNAQPSGSGNYAAAYGINDRGQVTGWAYDSAGNIDMMRWDSATSYVNLGASIPKAFSSIGYSIDNNGNVAGVYRYTDQGDAVNHAVVYGGGGPMDLGTLDPADYYINSAAYAINNARTTGASDTRISGTTYTHAFYSAGAGMMDIDNSTGGKGQSIGYAINANGVAGGTAQGRAFTYDGTVHDLGKLNSNDTFAAVTGINDSGTVVGASATSQVTHGFVKTSGGSMADIGSLGGQNTWAASINNSGQIVGVSNTPGTYSYSNASPFIYSGGQMYLLENQVQLPKDYVNISLPYDSYGVNIVFLGNHINNFGQIAATVNAAGENHACILNPINPLTTSGSTAGGASTLDAKIVAGMNFNKTPTITNAQSVSNHTVGKLLDGTATQNRDTVLAYVDSSDLPPVGSLLASDRLTVTGTGSDAFVLQLSYNAPTATALFGSESPARLDWLDPQTGTYQNAVLGNDGGTAHFVNGPYDSANDFHLGYYGIDTANDVVWAVIDHNSDFAVGNIDATPEPTMLGMSLAALALLLRRSRVN